MRVLHVIARMNVGGTATYMANLLRGLEQSGISNLLVMGNVPKGEVEDSVVSSLNFRRIESLSRELSFTADRKARHDIEAAIAAFKPDIIHTHTFKAGFLVRLRKRRIPVVHSFHGHHLYDPEFGFFKRTVLNLIERKLASRTSVFVTVGKRVRDELLAVDIGEEKQFVSIAPGIAPLELVSDSVVRNELGFKTSEILVVWLGRFTRVKRPDRVVEIARMIPGARFVMAGGGEMLDSLKLNAPSNVTFVGFQDKNAMWSIADIALCTSDSEGMPLALIEAQMAGIPVISTNVGSVGEIIIDGVTGRLASCSVEDLAEKLQQMIDGFENIDEMGKSAQERAQSEFSSKVMVNAHINLYRRILGKVES